jgi:ABC-2 type transport system permease protein
MERFWSVMKKETYHILRDARTLGLILVLPAFLLVLLGYGISVESRDVPIAVADLSKTDASRAFIESYTVSGDFLLAYDAASEAEILSLIDQDKVDVGIFIPEDFGRKVATVEPAQVQVYINGATDPTEVQTIQLKLGSISQMVAQHILIEQIGHNPQTQGLSIPIEAFTKTLYNPDGIYELFMIPGLVPIILQLQTLILAALAIVKEREQGTMEQLIVTPIRSWELMLGKMVPYLLVSVFNLFALVWLANLLFGVRIAGSFWDLILLSVIFIVGSLGLGVLISNLAQSQMQAIYLVLFLVLIPAIILSGALYPRDNMPVFSRLYSELLPLTHYLVISRGIILRGASAAMLWNAVLPLLILSAVYFVVSVLVFRKRI